MLVKTILVIEDEDPLQRFVEANLRAQGYRVVQATDGEEGLSLARKERPDLILLDLMLPRLDGWEVLNCLQASAVLKRVPVAVITASANSEEKDRACRLGAADYLIKPMSAEELVDRVRDLLGGVR